MTPKPGPTFTPAPDQTVLMEAGELGVEVGAEVRSSPVLGEAGTTDLAEGEPFFSAGKDFEDLKAAHFLGAHCNTLADWELAGRGFELGPFFQSGKHGIEFPG